MTVYVNVDVNVHVNVHVIFLRKDVFQAPPSAICQPMSLSPKRTWTGLREKSPEPRSESDEEPQFPDWGPLPEFPPIGPQSPEEPRQKSDEEPRIGLSPKSEQPRPKADEEPLLPKFPPQSQTEMRTPMGLRPESAEEQRPKADEGPRPRSEPRPSTPIGSRLTSHEEPRPKSDEKPRLKGPLPNFPRWQKKPLPKPIGHRPKSPLPKPRPKPKTPIGSRPKSELPPIEPLPKLQFPRSQKKPLPTPIVLRPAKSAEVPRPKSDYEEPLPKRAKRGRPKSIRGSVKNCLPPAFHIGAPSNASQKRSEEKKNVEAPIDLEHHFPKALASAQGNT